MTKLPKFLDILSAAINKKNKTIEDLDKLKKARDAEFRILNRKVQKFNSKQEVSQYMIREIQKREKSENVYGAKTIFKGKFL